MLITVMSNSSIFVCSKCDAQYPKWSGRCLECGAWGTLQESRKAKKQKSTNEINAEAGNIVELSRLPTSDFRLPKIKTNFNEFDKVLGGGITQGSLILLGGDPGVGKSTLALQIAAGFNESVLYVSAEESAEQVHGRFLRLAAKNDKLKFLSEDNLETILATIEKERPSLVIIDSIQTIYSEEGTGFKPVLTSVGNVNQIRACTAKLLEFIKKGKTSVILIGHVTKEGELSGPKAMEHLVDAVLYLEGDKYHQYRLLRAAKNRFGPTDEVGILEMVKSGLKAVLNPSNIFLAEVQSKPGSIICAVAEGSQVFLVEVQALVSKTSFGYPKRAAVGFDQKRLELLTTVLTKRASINLANFDVYLNIAGGLTLKEPALDLAVCASIISAYQDKVFPPKTVIFGEVGLGGEVRSVQKTKERVKETLKLGFKKIILPDFEGAVRGVDLIKVKEVKEVIFLFK